MARCVGLLPPLLEPKVKPSKFIAELLGFTRGVYKSGYTEGE